MDSIGGASEVDMERCNSGVQCQTCLFPHHPEFLVLNNAFASLDTVNLAEMFSSRARVMQSVPWVLRALKVAMQEIFGWHRGKQRV